MVNKNTVINNKNIVQVYCVKPTRKKQKTEKDSSGSSELKKYLKDNAMDTQPFNLVNSFPNSTGLEDRRARFIDAMRDPNSTKSPYSIVDNGSNTFERQGNTAGAEQPVQPSISQNDYFQTRQASFSMPKSILREPQRMVIDDYSASSSQKPWMRTRFQGDIDDATSQLTDDFEGEPQPEEYSFGSNRPRLDSSNYSIDSHNDWYSPSITGDDGDDNYSYNSKSFGIGPALEDETELEGNLSHSLVDLTVGPTRFEEAQQQSAPFMESPYRMPEEPPENQEAQAEQEALDEERAEKAMQEAVRRVDEDRQRKEGMTKQRQALADELERQKEIDKKYKSVKQNLEAFIQTTKDASDTKAKKEKPAQLKKADNLRIQISLLLNDPTFIEYEGRKNIGNLRNANKLLQLITDGSKAVEERIKSIEADKKEDIKRVIPATRGNIQTFKAGGGRGGIRAGGGASIANML